MHREFMLIADDRSQDLWSIFRFFRARCYAPFVKRRMQPLRLSKYRRKSVPGNTASRVSRILKRSCFEKPTSPAPRKTVTENVTVSACASCGSITARLINAIIDHTARTRSGKAPRFSGGVQRVGNELDPPRINGFRKPARFRFRAPTSMILRGSRMRKRHR